MQRHSRPASWLWSNGSTGYAAGLAGAALADVASSRQKSGSVTRMWGSPREGDDGVEGGETYPMGGPSAMGGCGTRRPWVSQVSVWRTSDHIPATARRTIGRPHSFRLRARPTRSHAVTDPTLVYRLAAHRQLSEVPLEQLEWLA